MMHHQFLLFATKPGTHTPSLQGLLMASVPKVLRLSRSLPRDPHSLPPGAPASSVRVPHLSRSCPPRGCPAVVCVEEVNGGSLCGFPVTYKIHSQLLQICPRFRLFLPLTTSCLDLCVKLHVGRAVSWMLCLVRVVTVVRYGCSSPSLLPHTLVSPFVNTPSHLCFSPRLCCVFVGHEGCGEGNGGAAVKYTGFYFDFLQQVHIMGIPYVFEELKR